MVDFLLFQLNLDLLQKVICKVLLLTFFPPLCTFQLNANSYFRLQQASRGVGQFIRTCRNICIHEEGRYVLCSKDGQSSYHLYHLGHRRYINVKCFYGTRINQLRPRGQLVPIPSFTQCSLEATEEFEPLYCSLEENRITCMQLSMEAGI